MATCISAQKMAEMLREIQSTKGDILGLVKMSYEKREKFFAKVLDAETAKNINNKFERALASKKKRAVGDWLNKNFNARLQAKQINQKNKNAIEKYILDKMFPIKGNRVEIKPSDIAKMSGEERTKTLKKFFKEEDIADLNKKLDTVKEINVRQQKAKELEARAKNAEKEINLLTSKLDKYLKKVEGKLPEAKKRVRPSTLDIVKMAEKERLEYFKSIGIKNAEKVNDTVSKARLKELIAKEERRQASVYMRKLKSQETLIKNFLNKNNKKESLILDAVKVIRNKKTEADFIAMHEKTESVEKLSEIFKQAERDLKSPRINNKSIDEILSMEKNERLKFLSEVMPSKNAEEVNKAILKASKTPFESKMEREMRELTNISEVEAYAKGKISQIVNEKSKAPITDEQMTKIMELSDNIRLAREKSVESGLANDRIAVGERILELQQYQESLMPKADWKTHALSLSEVPRMALATGELSALGIQGRSHLLRFLYDKKIWGYLKDSIKIALSKDAEKRYLADVITRDSYAEMKKSGVRMSLGATRLSQKEEGFMTNLFKNMENSKIPVVKQVGTIGEGFSRQYASYITMLRVEKFDDMYQSLKNLGATKEDFEELGRVINDATGGSGIKALEKGEAMTFFSSFFFSLRKILSDVRMRTVRPVKDLYRLATGTKAQKMIAREGLKRVGSNIALSLGAYGLTMLAKAGGEDVDVDTNMTSSTFGDIRIGDKIIKMDSGNWWNVLAARMLSDGYVDSNGIYNPYGDEFGQLTKADVLGKTLRYKVSPNVALAIDFLAGESAVGEKFFAGATRQDILNAFNGDKGAYALLKTGAQREAFNRLVPMYWQTLAEDPNLLQIPGVVGFSQRPVMYDKQFIDADGKKMKQFNKFIGVEKIPEAEGIYNKRVYDRLKSLKKEQSFKDMDEKDKLKEVQKIKSEEVENIFYDYGFVYEKETE